MATKKLSTGFTGSTTRAMGKFEREVEKRLDMFTDEFSPPYSGEAFPGGNFQKSKLPYGKPHEDTVPEAESQFLKKRLAPAGKASEQPLLDKIDQRAYQAEASIKKPSEQFPGSKLAASDNAAFDPHSVDPARLKAEAKKAFGLA